MKTMQPPSVAIFFMTYFHRVRATPQDPLPGLLEKKATRSNVRILGRYLLVRQDDACDIFKEG